MLISDKLIYLELHKTGCSHIIKLLNSIPSINAKIVGKHNTIYQIPNEVLGDLALKVKAGNIRNPWDWYVSLWAFGCMGKGRLHGRLTSGILKKIKKPEILFIPSKQWKHVYSDSSNPALFREWLKMLFSIKRRGDIGEEYGNSQIADMIGLLTFRYFKLYTYDFLKEKEGLLKFEDIINFEQQKNMLDFIIRNESLEVDFENLMLRLNIPLNEYKHLLNAPKTNTSKRNDYREYYDDETKDIVMKGDRFIIEKYDYSF